MAVTPNNYASLGLQQDEQGNFSAIPGFGIIGGDTSPEALSGMSEADLRGLILSGAIGAQNKSQEANLGLLAEQLNTVGQYGTAARGDIRDAFTQQRARSTQSLQARGLGGTTAVEAAEAGLAGREARAYTRLDESMAQNRMSVLGGANFQQPDVSQLYGQMLQSGQSGVGQGAPDQPHWAAGPLLGGGIAVGTEFAKQGIKSLLSPGAETGPGMASMSSAPIPPPSPLSQAGFNANAPDVGFSRVSGETPGWRPTGSGTTGAVIRGQSPDSSTDYLGIARDTAISTGTTAGVASLTSGGASTAGYASLSSAGTASASSAGAAAGATGSTALAATLAAVAPWIAAGVAAYFVYRNNKPKVDNLYDDAEEYVKDAYDDTEERIKKGVKKFGKGISKEAKSVKRRVKRRLRKWGL